MSAKLGSRLPEGSANGLSAIADGMVEEPDRVWVIVALIDTAKLTHNVDSGDIVPTARIRRIEAITDLPDGHKLRQLLRRAWERRTGKDVLPLDLEDDLAAAFGTSRANEEDDPRGLAPG